MAVMVKILVWPALARCCRIGWQHNFIETGVKFSDKIPKLHWNGRNGADSWMTVHGTTTLNN